MAPSTHKTLFSKEKYDDRTWRLFIRLCLAATGIALVAGTMTYSYGHEGLGLSVLLAAFTLPLGIAIQHMTGSIKVAGHYLVANIFIQSILFAADPAVGCLTLIALAAAVPQLGREGGRAWLVIIVARCLYVAVTTSEELGSATAAVAALVACAVYLIVATTEASRALASLRARSSSRTSEAYSHVLQNLVREHFDAFLQTQGQHLSHVSEGVTKLLGYRPDELLTRDFTQLVHPDDNDTDFLLENLSGVMRREVRIRHGDGRWLWVEAYIAPDLTHQKTALRNIILRDYDKQRKVSDQLLQVQRLESMGNMAAAVAHDFNNMLTIILGITDDLPEGPAKEEIKRVAGSATSLTNKLLSLGHGQVVTHEVLDLSDVLRDQSSLMQHALDGNFVLIESYPDEPTLVRIDEGQFKQIFLNLFNNAREAMHNGGELEVSLFHTTRKEGEFAVLEISDTGVGMTPEIQARVFDPFFSTKTTKSTGGLGLSSCYGLVSQYGGHIEIESEPDRGTTVRVMLPIAELRAQETTLELVDSRATVMIIDDDPGVLAVVHKALRRAGYQARGFSNPNEALEFFDRSNVSAVITDVVMSGQTGPDVVEALRELDPKLPVLFISGFAQDHLNNWRLQNNTLFLAKPFHSDEVIERLNTLLGKSEQPALTRQR